MTKRNANFPFWYAIKQFVPVITFLLMNFIAQAQDLTQTVRGSVLDKVTQSPVAGATVILLNSNPLKGTATDANGQFVLTKVPVGRQSIKVTYLGYKEAVIPNIVVNSGKEVVLTIQIEEQVVQANEVVVKANARKNKPINELAAVSARTFSVEETQKFAGAVNDPGRMATSFAGVVQGQDGNNTISVRGNSPNGMIWRMEGVDIPNPNHFAQVGTSGGGISILSSQLLANSDFLTGAFPAEYGNALSGVFDLRLRKGNNEKREYTFQAGFLGLDFASEGPFKKGYGGSYLVNYRYSTLSVLGALGLDVGQGVTNFQDLSFNVSLPTKKLGTFGVFGFGGLSSQFSKASRDTQEWIEKPYKQYTSSFTANTGAVGINNLKRIGRNTYVKTSVAMSKFYVGGTENRMNKSYMEQRSYEQNFRNDRMTFSSMLTHKIDARNNVRTGVIYSVLGYNITKRSLIDSTQQLKTWMQNEGNTSTVQLYGNWNHAFSNRLSANLGLHYLHLLLNNTFSVEPRASVKYELTSRQTLAFGYGLHGQIQPLGTYFAIPYAGGSTQNHDLKMNRAHHYVLSYDVSVAPHTHVKTEVYYQHLFNIPISTAAGSTYCLLNSPDNYTNEQLQNKGLARNYGLELTVERFLHRNFYYLLSSSFFDSKYRAANGKWYNTLYNTGFTTSFTGGKEWQLSEKHKKKVVGVNAKLVYTGGLRYTPIDLAKSIKAGSEITQDDKPFTGQNPNYFRLDTRFSIKRNFAHSTSTLALDIMNTTNHKNVGGSYYNRNSGAIKYWYQMSLLPVLSYRIEF